MAERVVKFEGLSQWRSSLCYELAGQSFQFVMDDGHDYLVNFVSGETFIWSERGKSARWESYQCLKADETTYFLIAEMHGFPLRTGITLVLDLEQRLVTLVAAHQGENQKIPAMVTNEVIFGAIKMDGEELPKKRHGYTTDLMGTRISWTYGNGMLITHAYYHTHYYRQGPMPEERRKLAPPEWLAEREAFPCDEPSFYVKIKDNLYLFSFIETTYFMHGRNGNSLTILLDTARLHDIGRSFGLDGEGKPENYLFGAIGKWSEADGTVETAPSVYRV